MKKTLIMSSAVILMVISLTVGLSFAGNGRGPETGICNNTGDPVCDICAGTPFEFTGDVVSMVRGQGIVIATEDEVNITIYGIGPIRYWVSKDVERPVIGDSITVYGHTVDYNGVVRNIATSIVVEDITVVLRNSETCAPQWRWRYNNRLRR